MGNVVYHSQWFWAPLVASGVSVAYFVNARNPRLAERIGVSAHGAVIALLYFSALLVPSSGSSIPWLPYIFWAAFGVPVILIVFALVRYQGRLWVHLLQVLNLMAAAWALFVGTMAVKGSWL